MKREITEETGHVANAHRLFQPVFVTVFLLPWAFDSLGETHLAGKVFLSGPENAAAASVALMHQHTNGNVVKSQHPG